MRTLALLLALVGVTAAAGGRARKPADDLEARISRIETGLLPRVLVDGALAPELRLANEMARLRVPGVNIAVVDGGAVAWSRAYGFADLSAPRPATPATRFQVGEVSTLVSSYAALALVKAGKLALDEDINKRLAIWKVPDSPYSAEKKVTLRRLLSHSAGFGVEWFDGYESAGMVPTLGEVLDGTAPATSAPIRVEGVPGIRFRYSAGGYAVLQQLVIDVTHGKFTDAMDRLVLRPAGMKSASFEQPPARAVLALATGYAASGAPVSGGFHVFPEQAAAGLWCTAEDLALFAIEVQRARAGKGKVLSQELARAYLTPGFSEYALGPRITGSGEDARFSLGGVAPGFEALLVAYEEQGKGAVVLTNAEGGLELAQEILLAIAREYRWPDYAPRPARRIEPELLDSLAGSYQFEAVARDGRTLPALKAKAVVEGGRLYWEPEGLPRRELFAQEKDRFFALDGAPGVWFERDAKGKVTGAVVKGDGAERKAKRL